MPKRRTWIILLLMMSAATSVLVNVYLFSRARQYYLDLNAVRLDPIGMTAFTGDMSNLPHSQRKRVVFFGDSRAARWPTPANINRFEFINRGLEAQTSAQAQLRFAAQAPPLQPDVVIVQVGINDLKAIPLFPDRRADIVAATEENTRQIVEQAIASGARVILTTIFPAGEFPLERRLFWSPDIAAAVDEVNAYLRSLAGEHVSILDAASLLVHNGQIESAFYADELHLNEAGYAVLNEALAQLLMDTEAMR